MLKKNCLKIYPVVVLKFDVKRRVAFLFVFSIYNLIVKVILLIE